VSTVYSSAVARVSWSLVLDTVSGQQGESRRRGVAFLDGSRWPWADLITDPVGLDRVGKLLSTPMASPRAAVRPGPQ
jgi:hypothetical protein